MSHKRPWPTPNELATIMSNQILDFAHRSGICRDLQRVIQNQDVILRVEHYAHHNGGDHEFEVVLVNAVFLKTDTPIVLAALDDLNRMTKPIVEATLVQLANPE